MAICYIPLVQQVANLSN